ncbi:MAG: hypothetical protein KDI63_02845 [Gammaproteobacteria bacterium]|nr:hypothetical protein [Gammaproteobacteria bacterium]
MWTYSCSVMRATVLSSALLFAFGLAAQLPAVVEWAEPTLTPALISYLGLLAMLLSPIVLVAAVVVSSLPGINRRLGSCQH